MAKLRRGFVKEAEELAESFRQELGLKVFDHLPSTVLADHLGIYVFPMVEILEDDRLLTDLYKGNISGLTLPNHQGKRMILYNSNQAKVRQESTIMHEIAHNVLNHHQIADQSIQFSMYGRTYNPILEEEANVLGATLQIPKAGLNALLRKNFDQAQLAETFNASADMVRYRYNKCGFGRFLGPLA